MMIYFSTGALVVAADEVVPERMALWSGAAPVGGEQSHAELERLLGAALDRLSGPKRQAITGALRERGRVKAAMLGKLLTAQKEALQVERREVRRLVEEEEW